MNMLQIWLTGPDKANILPPEDPCHVPVKRLRAMYNTHKISFVAMSVYSLPLSEKKNSFFTSLTSNLGEDLFDSTEVQFSSRNLLIVRHSHKLAQIHDEMRAKYKNVFV